MDMNKTAVKSMLEHFKGLKSQLDKKVRNFESIKGELKNEFVDFENSTNEFLKALKLEIETNDLKNSSNEPKLTNSNIQEPEENILDVACKIFENYEISVPNKDNIKKEDVLKLAKIEEEGLSEPIFSLFIQNIINDSDRLEKELREMMKKIKTKKG